MSLKVMYSRSALDKMFHHTLAAGEQETGGTLVGMQRGDLVLVLAASGPGAADLAGRAHFELRDLGHLRAFVDEVQEGEPSASWIGTWHKHPAGYRQLSPIDVQQGREYIEERDLTRGVFLPLTWLDDDETPRIRSFWLERGAEKPVVVPHDVVDLDAGVPWARTARGRRVVDKLRTSLHDAGWRTKKVRTAISDGIAVELSRTGVNALLIVKGDPRETPPDAYVLNNPRAGETPFVFELEGTEIDTCVLDPWADEPVQKREAAEVTQ